MLRLLPVLLLVLPPVHALAAESRGGPVAEACRRSNLACQDGCAVDWGSSMSHRKRLEHCLKGCERKESTCRERALNGPKADLPEQRPYREEQQRSRYAEPTRPDPSERSRSAPARSGSGKGQVAPPLNVGAPDWLDDAPSRKSAPSRATGAKPAAEAAAGPEKKTLPSTLAPLPSLPPAGRELPLEDAPLDDFVAAERDPLTDDGLLDDALLDDPIENPLGEPPARSSSRALSEPAPASAPAPSSSPRSRPAPGLAEAEELAPLDDAPASEPSGPGSRSLPSGLLDEPPTKSTSAAKSATPAKGTSPAKSSKPSGPSKPEKAPAFGKKKDISDWDPD